MEDIVVRSRQDASMFCSDKPWAAIQIASDESWPVLLPNNLGTLQLTFGDVDGNGGISTAQAKEILDFMSLQADRISILLVHCEAGQSRSPGAAAALSLLWFGKDTQWFNDPRYTPNRLVYRTILSVAERLPEYQPHFERILSLRNKS